MDEWTNEEAESLLASPVACDFQIPIGRWLIFSQLGLTTDHCLWYLCVLFQTTETLNRSNGTPSTSEKSQQTVDNQKLVDSAHHIESIETLKKHYLVSLLSLS